MKKMVGCFLLLILMITSSTSVNAQVVYFCNQAPVNGLPVDNASAFNFETTSGFLKVLLNNQKNFAVNKLMMTVKELIQDSFVVVNQNVLTVDQSLPWATTDYHFDHDGDFRFVFSDGLTEIARGDVNINVNEDYYPDYSDSDSYSDDYNDPSSTMYYMESTVEASIPDQSGNFQSAATTFLLTKGSTLDLVFKVSNPKGIVTDMLYVDVYSKKGKDSFGNFIETKELTIYSDNPSEYTFTDSFSKKGEYAISVYTHDNVWINDCYITINNLH